MISLGLDPVGAALQPSSEFFPPSALPSTGFMVRSVHGTIGAARHPCDARQRD